MSKKKPELTVVKGAIDTAEPEPAIAPPEAAGGNNTDHPPRKYNSSGLPEDSHIIALGTEGKRRHYLDANGQHFGLDARDHTRAHVLAMLGPYAGTAANIWPRIGAREQILGFSAETAIEQLFAASGKRLWSPRDRIRGRGFWLDPDGELLVHAGRRLFHQQQWLPAGRVIGDEEVYPAREGLMLPELPADPRDPFAAGRQALELFGRWTWKQKIGPRLALGAWASLVSSGALTWRPVVNVAGDSQFGKSLLCKAWDGLAGGWILLTEDATEAGIRQSLGPDAIGVIIDENEPDENGRAAAINRMARRSSGGGRSRRGTTTAQEAIQFTLRSTVATAAIDRVGFLEQDVNRRIILALDKPALPLRPIDAAAARKMGAQLLHLLIEGWPRLKPAIEIFHALLIEKGHQDRQALVYAQLLALADILTTAEPVNHDHAEELVAELGAADLPDAALALSDENAWLQRFAATLLPLDMAPGIERRPIAEWLALASRLRPFDAFYEKADRVLRQHGIAVVRPKLKTPITEFWVALRHPLLERIHASSKWKAEDGVGRWCAAAQKLPGATGCPYRLFGPSTWGAKVPLELIVDEAAANAAVEETKRQASFAQEFDANDR